MLNLWLKKCTWIKVADRSLVAAFVRSVTSLLVFTTVFTSAFFGIPNFSYDKETGEVSFSTATQTVYAAGTTTVIFITDTSTTTWVVPSDWNSSSNTIEVIGAGGGGALAYSNSPYRAGSGGGGGGYSKTSNVSLAPNSVVTVAVGSGGGGATTVATDGNNGGNTIFCKTTGGCSSLTDTNVVVSAEGGKKGIVSASTGGAGGSATNASGTVKWSGGKGGNAFVATWNGGGGGGGAAGPNGDGGDGGIGEGNSNDASGGGGGGANGGSDGGAASNDLGGEGGDEGTASSTGGAANSGLAGDDGTLGGGGAGGASYHGGGHGGTGKVIWTQTSDSATAGPGGGGGASGVKTTSSGAGGGGDGGTYGGGGGGTSEDPHFQYGSSAGGDGGQGIIVITYTTADGPPDTTPPTPSTMSFSSAPAPASATTISMTSVTATDASSSVQYNFYADAADCGSNYGTANNSGWQSSASYTDTSLSPNKCYGYKVIARDTSGNTNGTSSASSAYTYAATPGAVTFSSVSSTSITISNTENGNPSSNPTTYFKIYASSTDGFWNDVYLTADGNKTTAETWLTDAQIDGLVLSGLAENQTYEFISIARNADNIETASSTLASVVAKDAVSQFTYNYTERVFITDASLTTWTVPSTWNDASNTIEVIGGGGGAGDGSGGDIGSGGGGGAYSKSLNIDLTPGASVALQVGDGGALDTVGEDTYFCNSASNCTSITDSAVVAGAKGGGAGTSGTVISGGAGGAAASGKAYNDTTENGTDTQKYSGGAGGNSGYNGAGGGGGAAGPYGAGGDAGDTTTSFGGGGGGGNGGGSAGTNGSTDPIDNGGDGGDNASSTGGGAGVTSANGTDGSDGGGGGGGYSGYDGGAGSAGTEWTTAGSGGGGGGGGSGGAGGTAGLYGAGGAGEGDYGGGSTPGAQGIIVLTWEVSGTSTVWNATDWTLYDTITIDSANIDSTLTDFPVYVDLSDLSSQFWSTTPTSSELVGTDIRVTNSSNTELPRELVFASSTLQTGELHFKADSISSSVDTTFKIWYNGSTEGDYLATATSGAQNVWTNDYVAVYHLNEEGNNDPAGYTDSTSFANHGTGTHLTTDSDVVGQLGTAQDFDGLYDEIRAVSAPELEPTESLHLSFWVKPNSEPNEYGHPVHYGEYTATGNPVYGMNMNGTSDTDLQSKLRVGGSTYYASGSNISNTKWNYMGTDFNGSMLSLYQDGSLISTTSAAGSISGYTSAGLGIGTTYENVWDFDGSVDEVRIASTSRSTAWVAAEYLNQSTTTDFYTAVVYTPTFGSSTISNSDATQTNNAFNYQNKVNEPLFTFKITPNSGNATVTDAVISISGVMNIDTNDFSNIRLYRDDDNDGNYDAGDTVLDATGVMTISGQSGSITFGDDFVVTEATNYIVVADWNAPDKVAYMTLDLLTSGLTMSDGSETYTIYGDVSSVQHIRNNRGGSIGGGSGQIGGDAPAGDGEVSGGVEGEGDGDTGAIDTNSGGTTIGDATDDFKWPTANTGNWSNGANAYDNTDGTYASETTNGEQHQFTAYNHGIPGTDVIQGIEVKMEISNTTPAGTISVALSGDNGSSWSSTYTTDTLTASDTVVTLGGAADTWGKSWTVGNFDNNQFILRVTGNISSGETRIDGIQVKVYHQAAGGGGGGGGAI